MSGGHEHTDGDGRRPRSEGRQLALLLLGGLLLAAIGVVGATAFPEPCEEFEGVGTLQLRFEDATAALPLDDGQGTALEELGEALGIGPWRGAVALPDDATVLASDFGFFVVTATDLVVLRPGTGVASAPRDRAGVEVVPVGRQAVGLVADDGTTAVVASDYERQRCGAVPPTFDVLDVDRGFAVGSVDAGAGAQLALRTLSGDEVWAVAEVSGLVAAAVLEDHVVVVTADRTELRDLRSGEVLDTVERPGSDVLLDVVDGAVLGTPTAPDVLTVTRVDAAGDALVTETLPQDAPVVGATVTPAGLVVATETALVTDRGAQAPLPEGVEPVRLVASEDGQVGLVVEVDGQRALVTWGRDLP